VTRAAEHALADALGLVPRIVAAEAERLPAKARGWRVVRAGLTSTRMAVAVLGRDEGEPGAVLKLPTTAEAADGLRREGRMLHALAAEPRVRGWCEFAPRPYALGDVLGQPYRLDRALPGRPPSRTARDDDALARAERRAAAAIAGLHAGTAARVVVGRELAERWIDARIEAAFGRGWRSGSRGERLETLRAELQSGLRGREVVASWIHGDYWLGNVLFSGDGSVAGIVDWDAAAPVDLPVHDVLHLLLYGQRLRSGRELGAIVRGRLAGAPWSRHERELLDRHGAWSHDGALPERHLLLLYWLRHVSLHLGQQGSGRGVRRRLWERRNVDRVLAAL